MSLLRHQQIDVTGIAQGGILKSGDGQRNALEDPEIDLLLAKETIQLEEMRVRRRQVCAFATEQARRAAAGSSGM